MNQMMRKNAVFYLLGLTMAMFFKYWYSAATVDELSFLLSPVNKLTSLLTGQESVYQVSQGHYFQAFNIIINKSCSGFNFFTLCSIMLIFLSVGYFNNWRHKAIAFGLSLLLAFGSTILVNTCRIYVSIKLKGLNIAALEGAYVHQLIGVCFFLFFLLMLYFVVKKLLENTSKLISL